MLVLARRSDESIVFPGIGVVLRILRVQGNVVRIGIDAPPEVRILREELQGHPSPPAELAAPATIPFSHALRNQLNKVTLRLHLLQRQLQLGKAESVDETLSAVLGVLGSLDRDCVDSPHAGDRRTEKQGAKCRVLIVEDESNERELLAGLLTMNGCDCATVEDGLAALQYLESSARPDFVLLDMRMPGWDGPRTVRQLRKSPRFQGLRIFAVSGTSPRDAGIETGPDGVDAWFRKPLNPQKLCDALLHGRGHAVESN